MFLIIITWLKTKEHPFGDASFRDVAKLARPLATSPCHVYEMFITLARNRIYAQSELNSYESIETAHNVIKTNYAHKLTLEHLSKLSGYSESRFSRLYKKLYKISPITHLLHTRIEAAKELLTSTDYSVSQISEACGFESIHYFSSKFKEITGVSPKRYKAENKTSLTSIPSNNTK